MLHRRTRPFLASASFTVLFQILTVTGHCQSPAVSFSETSSSIYNVPNLTRGYTIAVNQAFTVSALGMFDSDLDGLATTHIVTLWNQSGSVLASVNFPAGTDAQLINQFRYESITPVTLNRGLYTVGVYYPNTTGSGDAIMTGITDATTDPRFSIVSYEFAHPGYFNPVGQIDDTEKFGANFLITPVPEPSALALLGVGAAALMSGRRFRDRV
jgi:hypothetical protein